MIHTGVFKCLSSRVIKSLCIDGYLGRMIVSWEYASVLDRLVEMFEY